ncbi:cell wall-active antibiotic response 4TMS protein YvqF [Actinoallomurus bryophytorum]|uniref:Cell wall-active antibiotic response 4TMS protein YvqF n=1 Tax=Actinoallomurus bryophytorum TaxID=1490222 RepID=A0A543CC10_9ACTN|nr:cell wall-active antibiotic response 4TMS protein YvqF [Actinoallomurus bryophytorum]
MRASDSDRDRVADQLREAMAEGRLTAEEHAERLDAVYQAKTYAELAPIVRDLPATGGVGPPESAGPVVRDDLPPPHAGTPNIVAVFGGAERSGRWLVEPETNVVAVFGGIELDLRQAVLSRREVTINVVAIMGGVNVTVPPGVRVANSIAAILGGASVPPEDTVDPDAPVIRLTGFALFGGVSVQRRAAGDGKSAKLDHGGLHSEQRRIHREMHDEQRRIHREFREQQRELRRRHRGEGV